MCILGIPMERVTPKGWVRKPRRGRRNKPKAEPSRPEEGRSFFVRFKPQQGTARSATWTEYRDVSDIPKNTASVPSEIHRELCKRNQKPWARWMLTAIYVNFGGVQQSTIGGVAQIDLDGVGDERRDRAFQKIERDGGNNPVYVEYREI